MERLDTFSKILLATGTINYLASMIDGVNKDMKMIPGSLADGSVHKVGIERRDIDMQQAVKKLKEVMELLGNSLDEVCAIDQYVTTPAFNVIIHGHDEVEGDFENFN